MELGVELELVGRERELAELTSALSAAGPAAVEISGPAGVGKTRLLRELAREAEEQGRPVEYVLASRSVREIPFGAVSSLLPDDPGDDPTRLFQAARAELRRRMRNRRLLLAVDDGHELDDFSAAVVRQSLVHEGIQVALTVRAESAVPDALALLRKEESATRLELGPLPRPDADRLAAEVLGGLLAPELLDAVWRLAEGHPLYTVVALRAAREGGAIAVEGGRWHLVEPLLSPRLHELVLADVGGLDDAARRALEVVALAEPVEVGHLPGLVEDAAVERLRERGLVRSSAGRRGPELSTAHPLYAEVVRASTPPGRSRSVAGALCDAVVADPEAGLTARMQAALWMLDSGRPPDARLALDGAAEALRRGDYDVSERLARATRAGEPESVAAALVLGRSLGFKGRGDEALEVLGKAEAATDEQRVELALAQGHTLAFILGRPGAAAAAVAEAAAALPGSLRWQLDVERAMYSAITGNFEDTEQAARSVLANPLTSPPAQTTACVNLCLAQAMTGRLAGFDEVADTGLELAQRHADRLPLAAAQIGVSRLSAWVTAGRIGEAHLLGEDEVVRAERAGGADPMWLAMLGFVLGIRGRLAEAAARQQQAVALFAQADPFRLRSQSIGLLLIHLAAAGLLPADAAELLEQAAEEAGAETRLAVWIGRAAAWMAAASDPVAGARLAADAGRSAVDHDHAVWGALALYDAVRMGRPELVRDALVAAVASTEDAHLLETVRDHAIALEAGDADGLAEVGTRMARHGTPLFAAEAFAQEARCRAAAGDEPGARRAAVRVELCRRQCPEVATPALRDVPEGLTERELEIALLAAAHSSREIADRLVLSVRTVDNHLRSVYTKLDTSGRDALSDLIAPAVTQPS